MNLKEYKKFYSYVIPSILAFALSGVYTIIDGFFVGHSVGDIGLSTINIAYPVVALLQALGTGIGMGGAILYTLNSSSGKTETSKKYLHTTTILLFLVSIIFMIILLSTMTPVLKILGATGDILELGKQYLKYIVIGAIFQIFATGVVPIIRNNNGAKFAMITMISGFICNIILDYLFVWVFELSVSGAAIATIIGQALTAILGICYLIYHKISFIGSIPKNILKLTKDIIKIGIAPFGLSLSPIISHLFMNRFSAKYGGEIAIASYACIGYVFAIVSLLVQGVGDGSQPIISEYYGKEGKKATFKMRKLAYYTSFSLAVICIIALFFFKGYIGTLFGASNITTENVANTLPIFLTGFMFIAFSRVTTSYFYATEKVTYSYMLVYIEPIIQVLLLLILPHFKGQLAVWWCMPLAQIITCLIAVILKNISDKKTDIIRNE